MSGDVDGNGGAVRGELGTRGRGVLAPGQRMVCLGRFEEPFGMADPEREAYRRRFSTLFVDESTARHGGLGTVVRASNAFRRGRRAQVAA